MQTRKCKYAESDGEKEIGKMKTYMYTEKERESLSCEG